VKTFTEDQVYFLVREAWDLGALEDQGKDVPTFWDWIKEHGIESPLAKLPDFKP
jgi:hypothetical protein